MAVLPVSARCSSPRRSAMRVEVRRRGRALSAASGGTCQARSTASSAVRALAAGASAASRAWTSGVGPVPAPAAPRPARVGGRRASRRPRRPRARRPQSSGAGASAVTSSSVDIGSGSPALQRAPRVRDPARRWPPTAETGSALPASWCAAAAERRIRRRRAPAMPRSDGDGPRCPAARALRGCATGSGSVATSRYAWRIDASPTVRRSAANAASMARWQSMLIRRGTPRDRRWMARSAGSGEDVAHLAVARHLAGGGARRRSSRSRSSGPMCQRSVMRWLSWASSGWASSVRSCGCPTRMMRSSFSVVVSRFDSSRRCSSTSTDSACASSTTTTARRSASTLLEQVAVQAVDELSCCRVAAGRPNSRLIVCSSSSGDSVGLTT